MTLLLVRLPGDNGHEVLWPWEQDTELRHAALLHTASCHLCVMHANPVFGTDIPKTTFVPGCSVGGDLSVALREHAARKRAAK
jgi:hypothetical protein